MALAWLQLSKKSTTSVMPEERSLLAAASSSGISITAFQRHAARPVLQWPDVFLINAEQLHSADNAISKPPYQEPIGHKLNIKPSYLSQPPDPAQ